MTTTINFCTVVATAVAALTTTINFCTVVVTAVTALTTTINYCRVVGKLAYPASDYDDEVCGARGSSLH